MIKLFLIVAVVQWFLFMLDYFVTGNINLIVLPQAVGWSFAYFVIKE